VYVCSETACNVDQAEQEAKRAEKAAQAAAKAAEEAAALAALRSIICGNMFLGCNIEIYGEVTLKEKTIS
jgi:hypothetical protein